MFNMVYAMGLCRKRRNKKHFGQEYTTICLSSGTATISERDTVFVKLFQLLALLVLWNQFPV